MQSRPVLSELIADIYEASYQASLWPRVIEKIAGITDSRSGAILIKDNNLDEANGFYPTGLPSEALDDYTRLGHLDPAFPIMQNVPVGVAINMYGAQRHDLEPPEYYEGMRKKYDMGYVCGANIIVGEGQHAGLGLQRSAADAEYNEDVLGLVSEIAQHLQRALRIHREFIRLRVENKANSSGLDSLAVGLVLFDQFGTPVYINSVAESILVEHPAIELHNNRITPSSRTDAVHLHQLITSCLGHANTKVKRGGVMGLRHEERTHPLVIMVRPVATSELANIIDGELVYAAMYINDPERPLPVDAESIATLFQLSRTEAKIAISLANGMSVEEIALSQNRSVHTVRSHLKSIYHKTSTYNQAGLVRLVMSGGTILPALDHECSANIRSI